MTLVKKLTKQGNSNAVVLDKGIMDLVGIKPNSWVEISTDDGRSLTIKPAAEAEIAQREDEHMAKVQSAIDKTHERFDGVMKRLAE